MEPNSSFLAAREVSRTPNRTMLQSFPSIAGDIDLPRRRPRTAIIDRSAEKFAVAAAIMGTCTCTHAQQVCPRCRRRAKDEVVLCLEARRIGVICSTYRKVDIPGETCPECAGRAVRRHTSQNSPYLSGWLPQSAADANNARGTGHRRQSLGQALGLAAKESLSNMRNYMKKPERVPSPGAGTLTAAAWRATHKDVDVFATTRYESAVAPRDKVIIRGRTVLDCEALSNASRSTIWFPPIDQTHTGPSREGENTAETERQSQHDQQFSPLAIVNQRLALLNTGGSSSRPSSAASRLESTSQGSSLSDIDRGRPSGLQSNQTVGTSLGQVPSDRLSWPKEEVAPPIPARNPRRITVANLRRQESAETTWSPRKPRRLSAPGRAAGDLPLVVDVQGLAIPSMAPGRVNKSPRLPGEATQGGYMGPTPTHPAPSSLEIMNADRGNNAQSPSLGNSPWRPPQRQSKELETTVSQRRESANPGRIQHHQRTKSSSRRTRRPSRVPERTSSRRRPATCSSSVYSQY